MRRKSSKTTKIILAAIAGVVITTQRGTTIARSDHDGAVTVRLATAGITVTRERSLRPRYWHEG